MIRRFPQFRANAVHRFNHPVNFRRNTAFLIISSRYHFILVFQTQKELFTILCQTDHLLLLLFHKVLCILQFPQTQLFIIIVIFINKIFATITTKHTSVVAAAAAVVVAAAAAVVAVAAAAVVAAVITAIKDGGKHNVVESGALIVDVGFVQTWHKDNLDPAVVLEETVRDPYGDLVDLILPTSIKSNVARCSLRVNLEKDTTGAAAASVFVAMSVKPSNARCAMIDGNTQRVPIRGVPAINLVKVKPKDGIVGILWNVAKVPEGVLAWAGVGLSVPSQESSETGIMVDDSVGKAAGAAVLKGNLGLYNPGGDATTFEFGSDANVVKAGTLVVNVLPEPGLEHDLYLSVTLVERLGYDQGDPMDLVLKSRVKANVGWSGLAADAESNSVASSGASVLVAVSVKPSQIDLPSVNHHTQVISPRCIPTINLVKVKREFHVVGIARDLVIRLEGVSGVAISPSITPKELGEFKIKVDPSVGPPEKGTIFKVLFVDLDLWRASPWCRGHGGVSCWLGNGVACWPGNGVACWPRNGVACWPRNRFACWPRNRFACWLRNGVGSTAVELGRDTNVVETGALVADNFIDSRLEHDLDPPVPLEESIGNDDGDAVDLVVPTRVEANVTWSSLASNTEADTMIGSGATVLVLVGIEPTEVDPFAIDDNAKVVSMRCVPAINLVEVERELDIVGIARDATKGLERIVWVAIMLAVTSKELGKDRSTIDPSVGPSSEGSVLKVFVGYRLGRNASGEPSPGSIRCPKLVGSNNTGNARSNIFVEEAQVNRAAILMRYLGFVDDRSLDSGDEQSTEETRQDLGAKVHLRLASENCVEKLAKDWYWSYLVRDYFRKRCLYTISFSKIVRLVVFEVFASYLGPPSHPIPDMKVPTQLLHHRPLPHVPCSGIQRIMSSNAFGS